MIWLCQCLCPSDHCILAVASDGSERAERALREMVEALIERKAINHKREICGGTQFHYRSNETRFSTIEEAMPFLAEIEARQLATQLAVQRARLRNQVERN